MKYERIASDFTDFSFAFIAAVSFQDIFSETLHLVLVASVPVLIKEGIQMGIARIKRMRNNEQGNSN